MGKENDKVYLVSQILQDALEEGEKKVILEKDEVDEDVLFYIDNVWNMNFKKKGNEYIVFI